MLQEVHDQSRLWSRARPNSTTSHRGHLLVDPAAIEVHQSHPKLLTPLVRHPNWPWIQSAPLPVLPVSWPAMVLAIGCEVPSHDALAGFRFHRSTKNSQDLPHGNSRPTDDVEKLRMSGCKRDGVKCLHVIAYSFFVSMLGDNT